MDFIVKNPTMGYWEPVNWTPENGYSTNIVKRKLISPRPAAGSGSHLGLFIILNADTDNYHCSSTCSAGFRVGYYIFGNIVKKNVFIIGPIA